jgi:hypothetical protein
VRAWFRLYPSGYSGFPLQISGTVIVMRQKDDQLVTPAVIDRVNIASNL